PARTVKSPARTWPGGPCHYKGADSQAMAGPGVAGRAGSTVHTTAQFVSKHANPCGGPSPAGSHSTCPSRAGTLWHTALGCLNIRSGGYVQDGRFDDVASGTVHRLHHPPLAAGPGARLGSPRHPQRPAHVAL